ncbi:MAG: hypothetical protein AAGA40_00330 [Cyanobacteria bacterium P01_E01_bin.45]
MGFEIARRIGKTWEDAQELHRTILDFPFQTTGKSESDFEKGFATSLMFNRRKYNRNVITQIDKETAVQSVYCFGKKHRPDMTLDENGIAIEMKFVTYDGLRNAIGQGYLYRLRYKFVFLILVVGEKRRHVYEGIANGKEKDLEDTLQHLADNMNIFSYIVPSFKLKPPVKKALSFVPDVLEGAPVSIAVGTMTK